LTEVLDIVLCVVTATLLFNVQLWLFKIKLHFRLCNSEPFYSRLFVCLFPAAGPLLFLLQDGHQRCDTPRCSVWDYVRQCNGVS